MAAANFPRGNPNPNAMIPQPETNYSDRKTGLVVFGVAEIMLGGLCALAVPMVLIGQIFARRGPDLPHPPPILPALTMYALMAAVFIWLGIGSILARRWARALVLCLSAVALCGGVIGCAVLAFVLPRMMETIAQNSPHPLQPAALVIMKVVAMGTIFVMYVVIPGALFLFYRSPNVRRTCEVRDPVERWTDRCPLPVLAMSVVLGLGTVVILGLVGGSPAFPVFGTVVTGGSKFVVLILVAALLLYIARGLYLLRSSAWWVALGVLGVSLVSNAMTFWGPHIGELYQKMGFDNRTAAIAGQFSAIPALRWMVLLSVLPYLVWLLLVRRYFRAGEAPPVITEALPPPL
jgi:hypothetical protein